jgi:hypothetical protein
MLHWSKLVYPSDKRTILSFEDVNYEDKKFIVKPTAFIDFSFVHWVENT